MFLPISHDRMVVSRWPWVSAALFVACVVVFVATRGSAGERTAEEAFEAAARYAVEHPELETDRRLLPPELREAIRADLPAEELGGGEAGDPGELDRLTAAWLSSLDDAPAWRWGLVPARLRPPALITHAFLHSGWLHLIGNLFMLYLTAPLVEDRVGSGRFALIYLVGGVLAGALFALQNPDSFRPLVGASGAIAAVMGAFGVLLARVRVKILIWLGIPLGTMVVPAWALFPFWFLLQLVAGLRSDLTALEGVGGVAYWAHAWGFLAGLGFGFAFRGAAGAEPATPGASAGSDRLGEARRLLAKRRWEEAWDLLRAEARDGEQRDEAALALWELAKESGRAAEAAPSYERRIRFEARRGDPLAAVDMWRELRGALRGRPADPALAAEIALALERAEEGREARAELVEAALDGLGPATPPEVGARLAGLATTHSTAGVRRALGAAAARADLPAELRRRLSP